MDTDIVGTYGGSAGSGGELAPMATILTEMGHFNLLPLEDYQK